VLWRNGGPLQNDATPADVGPDDYTYWRARFGGTPLTQEIGLPGTLNWTAGEITGGGSIVGDPYSGGPDIRVGRIRTTNAVVEEVTGTVVQNGATTKLLLPYRQSQLIIGDGSGNGLPAPASSYTLANGTIGLAIGNQTVGQNDGSTGNSGILVRNGTFTMTGGQIIDATPPTYFDANAPANTLVTQRFLTVATAGGAGVGSESVSTANLNGGSINVFGGIRVATANNSRGYLNINGATIVTGGDSSIGYQPTTGGVNTIGTMTMTAGSFQVGRTDVANQNLTGRLAIGDRGPGILNMSGGSITVTRNIRVTNNIAAAGSVITMTGGTITTPNLEMRVVAPTAGPDTDFAASIILDGPTANFIQSTPSTSTQANIGNNGKALFEVRQGTALLGGGGSTIQVGNSPLSAATINVKGGKLTLGGKLDRASLLSVAPVIGLTGGTLEFNNTTTTAAQLFSADLTNAGSKLVLKPNAVQQVQVGSSSPAIPANFSMTSGSWDIEIGTHTAVGGADWFNVPAGTASLTGGTLNISYLPGFAPLTNDVFTILRGASGVTLNSGAVAISGSGSPNWQLQTAGTDIQLKYVGPGAGLGTLVPEPSSLALLGFALFGLLTTSRTRIRIKVGR
jgi:hypothetical protein